MIDIKAREDCCEEAAPVSVPFYVPCNRPAEFLMYSPQDKRHYRMCDMCAHHNLKRGMLKVGEYICQD